MAFIQDLLKKENLADCNSVNIPIKPGSVIKMNKTDNYEEIELMAYQYLIGKVIYLSFSIRPDIAFAVGQLSKQNADPRVDYLKVAKQVLCYLKGTMYLEITYRANENKSPLYGLVGYADSNYAGNSKDCNSVIGHFFFVNGAIVS